MMLLLLVASVFADVAEFEADVGLAHVFGKPTPGQFYGVTPLAEINDKPHKLTGVTFNFDATITLNDDLTIEMLKACHEKGVEVVTSKDLITAFDEHVEELGEEKFKELYFGGQKRIDTMIVALKNMREATDGRVAILSASWGTHVKRPWLKAPIDENYWAEYLVHLTGWAGLGFDREHVIGVYAPGPPVIPEKGEALEAYYKKMYGTTPVNVVHIDKFKYASRILAVGGNLLQPDPYYVQQFSLNELLVRMGGKQVTALDHIKNALFGRWGKRNEDAAAVYYTQEASSTSFVVYGFAALGVGALASVAWKAFQNRKLAEHLPLQTTEEPEL